MSSANYIKDARLKKKLTQTELAKILGLGGPQFIYNIESARNSIPSYLIKPIAKALNIDKSLLIKMIVAEIEDKMIKDSK